MCVLCFPSYSPITCVCLLIIRTLDPEEADFFYMPVYTSALAWPVVGWADFPWCVQCSSVRCHTCNHTDM
jgi:hypothetical protein